MARLLMRFYVALAAVACLIGTYKVYVHPPASMQVTRDGVPHFTPPVLDPQTGKAVTVDELVRRYKGAAR